MTQLTLENVTKRFHGKGEEITAVDELSLDIDDGEFLVLVGPSGCGKSTSLRMVAGLESVTEGSIRLDGSSIEDFTPQERDIAMVFQSYALYPHMTVRRNMRFGLEQSTDLDTETMNERVREVAEMMGIDDLLERKPRELSGGQQQRVALGRAIVRDPQVFLLDEPLANLDAKLRSEMRTELQRLQEELGVTTIYVTHDQTEAMTMSDRIAVLNDGVLQQVATPLEAYHRPANRFVAGFIGDPPMNFFDVERRDDVLVAGAFEYPLSAETADALDGATDLVLGIRPEDIAVHDAVENEYDFESLVDVVEPMGDENVLNLKIGGEGIAGIATVDGMRTMTPGENVAARLPESAIHLFDARTGEALRNRVLPDGEPETEIV